MLASSLRFRGDALLELRLADSASLNRAVERLEQASRLSPDNAGILNELAVAYLALGEQTQQLTPTLRALDAVERAAAADSRRPEILFNRALIQQRAYLLTSAARSWSRYLAVERNPHWRAEAESHARRLARSHATVTWDTALLRSPPPKLDIATRADLDARVTQAPHKAREFSFILLGAWGTAVRAGHHERAAQLLALAREIGAAAVRNGADHSVAFAVQAIDSAADEPERIATLAQGHARLADGFTLFYKSSYEKADSTLRLAESDLRSAGSAMHRWASFYRAAAEVELGRYQDAYRRFESIASTAGTHEPGLAGKAISAWGVSEVRPGHYEVASSLYHQAGPYLERAREMENHASIAYLRAESLLLAGQFHEGKAEALRGLQLLSPFRKSNYLNNHLSTVAVYARNERLPHAALAVMDEVLEVARGLQRPDVLARAHRAHARDLILFGRYEEARADLDEALRWASRLPAGSGRERTRADVNLVRAQLLRERDPRASLALLSEVVETYRRVNIGLHVPVALYEAAVSAEAAGDSAAARKSLDEAIALLERQQEAFRSADVRATFHETVENVFDAMIRIELAAGRPEAAFAYLERARAAIQPGPGTSSVDRLAPTSIEELRAQLPADVLLVDYALLENEIAVWTVSHSGWRHYRVAATRDSVASLVERFVAEAGRTDGAALAIRAHLFDLLVRPLAAEFAGVRRITVVPDRELYRLPLAALWNRSTQRYLVLDHTVTVVPSAGFYVAATALRSDTRSAKSALVVGNPALARDVAARLAPLPHAGREAREIGRLYGSRPLTGTAATRLSVLEQLPTHFIFHFAGHAVFNGEQPGSSYLALAPDAGANDGTLRAWEIGDLRLSNVQLVVLSACSTLSPRPSRAGATAGLAYSFLRAGAPATVSTLWDVVDGRTAPLLVEFHSRFAAGASAAEALRQAQLQALQSPRPELHAPSAWAAFIYTGS